MGSSSPEQSKLAFLVPDLAGGGVQRTTLLLARGLAERGHAVTIVLYDDEGPLSRFIPSSAERVRIPRSRTSTARLATLAAAPTLAPQLLRPMLLPLKSSATLPYLPGLARYLENERPTALFAATTFINVEALLARRLAGVDTRIVISERTPFSQWEAVSDDWRRRYLRALMRRTYAEADAVVTVSDGVRDDLSRTLDIPLERISTIYNPVNLPELKQLAEEPLDHPWFARGAPPVLLAVGRPGRVKDYATLLRAFARVRAQRPARLVILGENTGNDRKSRHRSELDTLAIELGIVKDVELRGYCLNPYSFMANAAVLVLSSLHEGFANVLVEALACGCPIVSTDCPVGPSEVLDKGRYGTLVPVGDDVRMADAITTVLDTRPNTAALKARAAYFSYDDAISRYEEALTGRVQEHAGHDRSNGTHKLSAPGLPSPA